MIVFFSFFEISNISFDDSDSLTKHKKKQEVFNLMILSDSELLEDSSRDDNNLDSDYFFETSRINSNESDIIINILIEVVDKIHLRKCSSAKGWYWHDRNLKYQSESEVSAIYFYEKLLIRRFDRSESLILTKFPLRESLSEIVVCIDTRCLSSI